MYGDPATVSEMPHQAPLRAISGYAPVLYISLLGDPETLSVLVCLASVCIIIRLLRHRVTSRFTCIVYVSCKCSPKCIIQVLCTYRNLFIRPQIPRLR